MREDGFRARGAPVGSSAGESMADNGKRVELRFGTFSCTIEGYDDPVEQVREILRVMQQMIRETPALTDHRLDEAEVARIESALGQQAIEHDVGSGIVLIRPNRIGHDAEDAVTTAEIHPGNVSEAMTGTASTEEGHAPPEADFVEGHNTSEQEQPVETVPDEEAGADAEAPAATARDAAITVVNIFAAPEPPVVEGGQNFNIFARPAGDRPRGRLFVPRRAGLSAEAEAVAFFPSSGADAPPQPDEDGLPENGRANGTRMVNVDAVPRGSGAGNTDRASWPEGLPTGPHSPEHRPAGARGNHEDEYRSRFSALLAQLDGQAEGDAADSTAAKVPITPAHLARRAEAQSVPDLLAVSAAWLTLVEGKPRFPRQEVLDIFRNLPGTFRHDMDERIKGFGRLVRTGRLLLREDGLFETSPAERDRFQAMLDRMRGED